MIFDYRFTNKDNFANYRKLYRFQSKKNNVYLIEPEKDTIEKAKYILKEFTDHERAEKEKNILMLLHSENVNVPEIYTSSDDSIIMEYIEGETLLDYFVREEKNSDTPYNDHVKTVVDELCFWFQSFYCAVEEMGKPQKILYDVNLRNFIYNKNIYGIDFEDCRYGKKEEDAGRLCAYFLTYSPEFTPWKVNAVNIILDSMVKNINLYRQDVIEEFQKELYSIQKRRNLIIPWDIVKNIK